MDQGLQKRERRRFAISTTPARCRKRCLLGNVAYRVGKKLQWDAKTLAATNCPEANQFLTKEYRQGWEVEYTA